MSYNFLKEFDEEVVCWYLTIETEYGKPPYLMHSMHIAGRHVDSFRDEELLEGPDCVVTDLTCGTLYKDGTFKTWAQIRERRRPK